MHCQNVRGSALDCFETCKLWYRYSYHDHVAPDIPVPKWAKIGWMVHRTLKEALDQDIDVLEAWKQVRKIENDIILEEVQSSAPLGFQLKPQQIPTINGLDIRRIKIMLHHWQGFRDIFEKYEHVETEVKFQVAIRQGKEGAEPWWYRGTIDVRCHNKYDWLIVDYKSSQPAWEYSAMPIQLWRYGIATALEHPVETLKMILFNLESGNKIYDEFDKVKAKDIVRWMHKQIKRIRATPAGHAVGNKGGHCWTLCPHSIKCPLVRKRG